MNKYKLTNETKKLFGITLYRIKALKGFSNVRKGELGGWIENEHNLSQNGNAWVYGNGWVCENARVYGNARVCDNARVYGNAWVCDNAMVSGNAWVCGDAIATNKVTNLITDTYNITITDKHIKIGCKQFTFERFMKLHKRIDLAKKEFSNEIDEVLPYRKVLVELVKLKMEAK
jgi:hypothetical protein